MAIIKQDYGSLGNDVQTQMLIAPVLAEMVATQPFAIGDQFIVDNVLYKATKAIAVGDTIVLGSGGNANTASTISEEAYRINDATETDIADDDYFPFFDASDGKKKKSLWSNIIDKIKSNFQTNGYVTSYKTITSSTAPKDFPIGITLSTTNFPFAYSTVVTFNPISTRAVQLGFDVGGNSAIKKRISTTITTWSEWV